MVLDFAGRSCLADTTALPHAPQAPQGPSRACHALCSLLPWQVQLRLPLGNLQTITPSRYPTSFTGLPSSTSNHALARCLDCPLSSKSSACCSLFMLCARNCACHHWHQLHHTTTCTSLPCHPRGHASQGRFNSLPPLLKGSDQYTTARSESCRRCTIGHAPTANGCPPAYLHFASQANKATQNWPTPIHTSPHKKLCLVSPSREPGTQIGSWRTVNLDCRIARALLFYSSAFVWNLLLVCLAAPVETPCVRLICQPVYEWT